MFPGPRKVPGIFIGIDMSKVIDNFTPAMDLTKLQTFDFSILASIQAKAKEVEELKKQIETKEEEIKKLITDNHLEAFFGNSNEDEKNTSKPRKPRKNPLPVYVHHFKLRKLLSTSLTKEDLHKALIADEEFKDITLEQVEENINYHTGKGTITEKKGKLSYGKK